MKNKKQKTEYIDNGMTIANMNVKGMPWYKSEERLKERDSMISLSVTRKERRAMMRGAFVAYLPVFLFILASFSLVFLLFLFLISNI